MPIPGEIWLDSDFFDGGYPPKRKFLLVLATDQGDITYRLLTSQRYGRPTDPPCYHGSPYPGFYLGVLGGPLYKDSWLDLSVTDDMDSVQFGKLERVGRLSKQLDLSHALLCPALRCVANAQDTTQRQSRRILDVATKLGCP